VFLRKTAFKMVSNGLLGAGWNFIWIDDGWASTSRDTNGDLVADPARFPNGMPALISYLHSLGFKVGIYSSFGPVTCLGQPGSDENHIAQDARLFASWGADGFKLDACGQPQAPEDADGYNRRMLRAGSNAILDAKRNMVFLAITPTTSRELYAGLPIWWEAQYEANLFVVWGVTETLDGVTNAVLNAAYTANYCSQMIGPGHYPWQAAFDLKLGDLPTLQAGITLAAMVSAPMTISSYWPSPVLNLLTNTEVLSIQQDPAAVCGSIAWSNNLAQIWAKPLSGQNAGACAIALVNLAPTNQSLVVNWKMLGAASDDSCTIRDLWAHNTLGSYTGSWTNVVPPNSVQLYQATGPVGQTTNITVLRPGGGTNTLVFKKGILINVQP
jgi:alpha-galactosidase